MLLRALPRGRARPFALQITHMVNCAGTQLPNIFENHGVKYLTFPWVDDSSCIVYDENCVVVQQIANFIDDALRRGESVLVHSFRGTSRCICCIMSYFMLRYAWGFEKTLQFILSRRPDAEPNPGFISQLFVLDGVLQDLRRKVGGAEWDPSSESARRRLNEWDPESLQDLPTVGQGANPEDDELVIVNSYINSMSEPDDLPAVSVSLRAMSLKASKLLWADEVSVSPEAAVPPSGSGPRGMPKQVGSFPLSGWSGTGGLYAEAQHTMPLAHVLTEPLRPFVGAAPGRSALRLPRFTATPTGGQRHAADGGESAEAAAGAAASDGLSERERWQAGAGARPASTDSAPSGRGGGAALKLGGRSGLPGRPGELPPAKGSAGSSAYGPQDAPELESITTTSLQSGDGPQKVAGNGLSAARGLATDAEEDEVYDFMGLSGGGGQASAAPTPEQRLYEALKQQLSIPSSVANAGLRDSVMLTRQRHEGDVRSQWNLGAAPAVSAQQYHQEQARERYRQAMGQEPRQPSGQQQLRPQHQHQHQHPHQPPYHESPLDRLQVRGISQPAAPVRASPRAAMWASPTHRSVSTGSLVDSRRRQQQHGMPQHRRHGHKPLPHGGRRHERGRQRPQGDGPRDLFADRGGSHSQQQVGHRRRPASAGPAPHEAAPAPFPDPYAFSARADDPHAYGLEQRRWQPPQQSASPARRWSSPAPTARGRSDADVLNAFLAGTPYAAPRRRPHSATSRLGGGGARSPAGAHAGIRESARRAKASSPSPTGIGGGQRPVSSGGRRVRSSSPGVKRDGRPASAGVPRARRGGGTATSSSGGRRRAPPAGSMRQRGESTPSRPRWR